MNNPGQYVQSPPPPPAKKGPSCWLIGGLGCLVVFIIVAILFGIGAYKLATNPKVGGMFGKAMQYGINVSATEKSMMDIQQGMVKYKAKNGSYPKSLSDLAPDYLAAASDLHSPLDVNTDPTHVSYTYVKPAATAPPTTEFIDIKYTIDIGVQPSSTYNPPTSTLAMTLNGQLIQATDSNGTVTRQELPTPQAQ